MSLISPVCLDAYDTYTYVNNCVGDNAKIQYIFFFLLADIDPCLKNNGDCSHNCSFGKGKRTCTCPVGYKLTYNLRTCKGL